MVELKKVFAGYGDARILQDVCGDFKRGSLSVIIGPNGSGKSTLLKCIAGILPLESGEILINGVKQSDMSTNELASHVAYLSQSRNVPEISVRRMILHGRFPYLSYPRRYSKKDYEVVDRAMEITGVRGLADKQVKSLSGGQRQKVYIAMALAQETDIILFDEPATYLDIKSQLELLDMAAGLAKSGKTVIMVSHDLDSSLRAADYVMLINNGQVLSTGNAIDVYTSDAIKTAFGVDIRIYRDDQDIHCSFKSI